MDHTMVEVTSFKIVGPYTLQITFDDGTEQTINFEPVLYGYYYAPLRDLNFFNQVRLDPGIHTLVWPNDADFDPATLYHWHQGDGAELARRAARWGHPEAASVNGYRLPLTIEPLEEGGFVALSPALPGFLVQAETIDKVLEHAPGVAEAIIEAMREKGIPLPPELKAVEPPFQVEIVVPAS